MAMTPKAIRDLAEKLGIPFLPPDHPEFTCGPQIHFYHRPSPPSSMDDVDSEVGDASDSESEDEECRS